MFIFQTTVTIHSNRLPERNKPSYQGQRSKRCLSSMKNSLLSRIGAGARGGTLPDAESNADRGQPGRGGRKLQSFRVQTRLNEDDAVTMESVPLIGPVRIVIARVAVADSQNPALAAKLEAHTVIGIGNQPALGIQNGNGNHERVLPVGLEDFPVG